jgi:nucleoside-diphosphate-sugar epimerase
MNIFLTGANGYIGSSVAARLIASGHHVRGLVRDRAKGELVRAIGVEPVIGSLDDAALLTEQAREADAVVNTASSDHRGAIEALVAGLAGSGKVLLHTSGSSIVGDEAMGEPSDSIFDEGAELRPEPDKEARVALDRFVLGAPGVRSVVLCNTLIYGNSLGVAAESVQLPRLVAWARKSGKAGFIGRGLNRWSTVHVADVADLYAVAIEKAAASCFCFVESGEVGFAGMAAAIGGRLGLGEAVSIPAETAVREWGRELAVFALGSNSRVRGHRARAEFGWAPSRKPVLEWIGTELPV